MNYKDLMLYCAKIAIPKSSRIYTSENPRIAIINNPEELMQYQRKLKETVFNGNAKTLRDFIEENYSLYKEEAKDILNLEDKTLETIVELIRFEAKSKTPQGNC